MNMYRSNIEHPSQTAQQRQLQQFHQIIYRPQTSKEKMNSNLMPNLIEINNSFQFPTRFLSNDLASNENTNNNNNNNFSNKNKDDSSILGRCSINKTENQYNLLFHKSTISKKHIQFKYDPINKKWYIRDLNTKHGSILSHSFKLYANDLSSRENSNTYFEVSDCDIIGLVKSSRLTINPAEPATLTHPVNHTQQQISSTNTNNSTSSIHSYDTSSYSSSSSGTSSSTLCTSTYKFKFFDYRVFKDTKFQILVSIRDNGLQLSVINIAPSFEEYTRKYVNTVKNNNNIYPSLNQKKCHQNVIEGSKEQQQQQDQQDQQQEQPQTSVSKKIPQPQEAPLTPLRNNSSRSKSSRTHTTDDYDELLKNSDSRCIDFNKTSSFSSPSSNSTSKSLVSTLLTDISSPRIVLPVKVNKHKVEVNQLPDSEKLNSSVELVDSMNSMILVTSIKSAKSIESIQSLTTEKSDMSQASVSVESSKSIPSSISSDYFDDDIIVKAFDSFNSSINLKNSVNQSNNPIIGDSTVQEIKSLPSEIPQQISQLDSPISLFQEKRFLD